MKSKFILISVLFFGSLFSALAAPKEEAIRGVYFRTIGVGVNEKEFLYQDGAKAKPFSIDTERRSPFYEYKGGSAPLVFLKELTAPDGVKISLPVADVTLPPSVSRVLLILFRQPGEGDKLSVVAMADSAKAVPPGGYRFVNFLPVQAGVILGGQKQIILPRDSYICEAPVGKDREASVYPFKIYIIKGESAIPVYSNVWSVDVRKRNLVLMIYSPTSPSGVEVKYLSESVNAIPTDEPEAKP